MNDATADLLKTAIAFAFMAYWFYLMHREDKK